MNQVHKNLMRQINKIYPPQISQSFGRIFLYNPLQPWVQSHNSSSLEDLIQIQGYSQPLFLNKCKGQIVLQSQHEIFLEDSSNEWMKTMKKRLASQKKIASNTVKVNDAYLNMNQNGDINVWKMGEQPVQGNFYNPESLKNIQNKEMDDPQIIATSINPERLVKQYRHGYSFSPLLLNNQHIYSIHQYESDGGLIYNKILKTDIFDKQGECSFYHCCLPDKTKKLLAFNNIICAYGGQNALVIDNRTQSIVYNINDRQESQINCISISSNQNKLYICRDKEILFMDLRKTSQLIPSRLAFGEQIDSLEIFQQNQKTHCCVSFKYGNKVTIAEL